MAANNALELTENAMGESDFFNVRINLLLEPKV